MKRTTILLSTVLITLPAAGFAGHNDWGINASQHRWANYYAETAVRQARQSLRLACGYHGGRWSTHYRGHYEWALRQRTRKGEVEIDRRDRALRECRSRRGHYGYRDIDDRHWRGRDRGRGHHAWDRRGRPDLNRGRDRDRRGRGHGRG
jgi:hypothetical protein